MHGSFAEDIGADRQNGMVQHPHIVYPVQQQQHQEHFQNQLGAAAGVPMRAAGAGGGAPPMNPHNMAYSNYHPAAAVQQQLYQPRPNVLSHHPAAAAAANHGQYFVQPQSYRGGL